MDFEASAVPVFEKELVPAVLDFRGDTDAVGAGVFAQDVRSKTSRATAWMECDVRLA
jgi:hypothetical protein